MLFELLEPKIAYALETKLDRTFQDYLRPTDNHDISFER